MLQQSFATPRDLEERGLGRARLQICSLGQRVRALQDASGWVAPALRKRNKLPLVAEYSPTDLDTTGMIGGASVAWSLTQAATVIQAVEVQFTAGGTVPGPTLAYQVNWYAGAYRGASDPPAFTAGGSLTAGGQLTIDGQTFTITGTVAVNDAFVYATVTDSGVRLTTVWMAAWLLLHNGGVDAKTEQDLQKCYDAALKFKAELAAGDGDLEQTEDATPNVPELGPLGVGQREPWSFMDRRGGSSWRR